MKPLRPLLIVAALAVVPAGLGACSDETKDKVQDAAESARGDAEAAIDDAKKDAEDAVNEAKDKATGAADQAASKAAAEYVGARVKAANSDDPRSVDELQGYADGLPDQVTVSGLDGDGSDSDGKVEFTVGDSSACLTIPESGTDTSVSDGAC